MSRRCDAMGVKWPRRQTMSTDDYLAARAASQARRARLGFHRVAASLGSDLVVHDLRDRPVLPPWVDVVIDGRFICRGTVEEWNAAMAGAA